MTLIVNALAIICWRYNYFLLKLLVLGPKQSQITNNYNTTSAVYARLSVNRDMVKHFEALGLLTTPVMFMLCQPTSQLLH